MKDVKQNTLKEEKIFNFLKKNNDFAWHLSLYEELESTNDYLIEFANPNEYCLCVAESQTKGRGRNLKKWQSPKYENIYMSLSFSTNQELKNFSSFSLVSALAVHNVLLRQNIFMKNNTEIDRDWTSLKLEFENIEIDRNEIISEIANEVLLLKLDFEKKGFDYFVKDFNRLNFLKDKKVFLSNLVNKEGTALDVNSDGSLNVRMGNKTKKISSGEVSIKIN